MSNQPVALCEDLPQPERALAHPTLGSNVYEPCLQAMFIMGPAENPSPYHEERCREDVHTCPCHIPMLSLGTYENLCRPI